MASRCGRLMGCPLRSSEPSAMKWTCCCSDPAGPSRKGKWFSTERLRVSLALPPAPYWSCLQPRSRRPRPTTGTWTAAAAQRRRVSDDASREQGNSDRRPLEAEMNYAKDVLVDTDWVAGHLDDDSIRIVEVDEDSTLYAQGHIPGAIGFDWKADLQDQVERNFLGPEAFAELMGSRGI